MTRPKQYPLLLQKVLSWTSPLISEVARQAYTVHGIPPYVDLLSKHLACQKPKCTTLTEAAFYYVFFSWELEHIYASSLHPKRKLSGEYPS